MIQGSQIMAVDIAIVPLKYDTALLPESGWQDNLPSADSYPDNFRSQWLLLLARLL